MMHRLIIPFILFFSNHSLAIYQGSPAPEYIKRSVIKIQMSSIGKIDSPCSASVYSKYAILTAAHCVDQLDLSRPIEVLTGGNHFEVQSIYIPMKYYDLISKFKQSRNIKEKTYYNRQAAKFDLAIINLKNQLPLYYKKVKPVLHPVDSYLKVDVIGYGLTNYSHTTNRFFTQSFHPFLQTRLLRSLTNNVYILLGKTMKDFITTPGDSGGGLFISKTNFQLGITRGSSATENEAASIFTPLWLHKSFLKRHVKVNE